MEELGHVLEDKGLTISSDSMKGRCLVATKDFTPGEVIMREEPYVCVPKSFDSSDSIPVCQGCFKISNLKKCSKCELMWYCGGACQKFDWQMHRQECRAISKLDKDQRNLLTPDICLVVRLHVRKKLQIDKIIPTTAIDNFKLLEPLVAHISSTGLQNPILYAKKAEIVKLMLQWPDIKDTETRENFYKLSCNVHAITSSEMETLGIGLYPVISIINHSCLPNSVLVFEGRQAVIRAIQHVRKDDEVLISYIDSGLGFTTRKKYLQEKYFFTCTCSRCLAQDACFDDALKCKNEKCSGIVVVTKDMDKPSCSNCGLVRNLKEWQRSIDKIISATNKALKTKIDESLSLIKKAEDLVKKLDRPPSLSLTFQDALLKCYLKVRNMQKALEYCRLTIPAYEEIYNGLHPSLGLRYYKCGKLESIHGNKANAIQFLNKAVNILKHIHGAETPLMRDLLLNLEKAKTGARLEL